MTNVLELSKQIPSLKIEVSATDLLETVRNVATEIIEHYAKVEPPEQYLTPKITTRKLDVSLSTLWRWDKEDYLKPVAIGGKRRYRLSDVERILNGGN